MPPPRPSSRCALRVGGLPQIARKRAQGEGGLLRTRQPTSVHLPERPILRRLLFQVSTLRARRYTSPKRSRVRLPSGQVYWVPPPANDFEVLLSPMQSPEAKRDAAFRIALDTYLSVMSGEALGVMMSRAAAQAARLMLQAEARGAVNVAAEAAGIATPYGRAFQSTTPAAIEARAATEQGATLYRGGVLGRSAGPEGQFWSLENPLGSGYAAKYGIPAENMAFDFIETATLKPGASFITREAPGLGANAGGAIEIVVNPGGVNVSGFLMPLTN